jgi:hypothetical protein
LPYSAVNTLIYSTGLSICIRCSRNTVIRWTLEIDFHSFFVLCYLSSFLRMIYHDHAGYYLIVWSHSLIIQRLQRVQYLSLNVRWNLQSIFLKSGFNINHLIRKNWMKHDMPILDPLSNLNLGPQLFIFHGLIPKEERSNFVTLFWLDLFEIESNVL